MGKIPRRWEFIFLEEFHITLGLPVSPPICKELASAVSILIIDKT